VANPFTGPERRRLIERTEELLGRKLAGLIEKHKNDLHEYPHRLIELHLRLLRAEDNAGDPMADNTSLVAGTEIAGVLDELDKWRADPVWPEYQRGLNEGREYIHTATTLCFANALRTRHPATELVPSGGSAQTKSRKETPDLRMVVRAADSLAVEVKTPTNVGSRSHAMTVSEAATAVLKALKEALRQLAGGPGMLVVGGFNIDAGTFTALGDAAGNIVERDGSESNLMAIVVANFMVAVGDPELGLATSEIGFGQKTRMRSSRFYVGPIEFVGEWNGKWELVRRHSRTKSIYVVRRQLM
jgi:hypothetical protein